MTTDLYIIRWKSAWWALDEDGNKKSYSSMANALTGVALMMERDEEDDQIVYIHRKPGAPLLRRLHSAEGS